MLETEYSYRYKDQAIKHKLSVFEFKVKDVFDVILVD